MSDMPPAPVAASPVPPQGSTEDTSLRQMAMLAYGLMFAACVTGLTAIPAVIIAYVKRNDALGTVWQSHYRNVIVVFWVMLAAFLAGMMTFPIALGLLFAHRDAWPFLSAFSLPVLFWLVAFPLLALWFLYRMIKGLIRASENRAF
jgi:uncharacterized membrane protein